MINDYEHRESTGQKDHIKGTFNMRFTMTTRGELDCEPMRKIYYHTIYRIEDMKTRRKRNLLRLMYIQSKCDANLCAKKKHIQLHSDVKIKMKSDFTRLTKIQRSPYYRGLGLWNALPEHVQKEPNKYKFKSAVKSLIID